MELSASVAQMSGPGLGGSLVQALSAPVAILLDALSFVIPALFLRAIPDGGDRPASPARASSSPSGQRENAHHGGTEAQRKHGDTGGPDGRPDDGTARAGIRREIAEGVRLVLREPALRALAGSMATFNFFDRVLFAVYVLYMVRQLRIAPAAVGLVFALGAVGGIVSALLADRIAARIGSGRALAAGVAVAACGEALVVLAGGPQWRAVATLVLAEMLVECGATLYGINAVSLRQRATPYRLLGRVSATIRVAGNGMELFGALLGGTLGAAIGLRPTITVGALGTLLALLWVVGGRRLSHDAHTAP